MTEQVISRAAKYGRVPVSLLCRDDVTGDECRLYAYLTTFDFKLRGEVWPGRERAAADLGWSVRKIDGLLHALAENAAIARIQAGNGRPARIELLADVVSESALQDRAALPDHVDSPARTRKRTSIEREQNESDSAVVEEWRPTPEELEAGRATAAALFAERDGVHLPRVLEVEISDAWDERSDLA